MQYRAPALLLGVLLSRFVSADVVETDWCTIETPAAASPGVPIEVKVTLKPGVAEGLQLAADLHWMKKDAFGGFLSWHPRRAAKPGAPIVFTHKPKIEEKMHRLDAAVFLSPDGDFKNKTKLAHGAAILVAMDPAKAAAAAAEVARTARPATATFKESSIRVVPNESTVTQGDEFEMRVECHLDPADHWGDGTKLQLMPLGPWIDNPDGTYTKTRQHMGYPGVGTRMVSVEPGDSVQVFKFKLGKTHRYNDISWLAQFIGGDGQKWPWSVRGGGPTITRAIDRFDVVVDRPAGLFTYDERPVVHLVWAPGKGITAGQARTVAFSVVNTEGAIVGGFARDVTCGAAGERTAVELDGITARGVLLVNATIEGVGTRSAFLARIPDLAKTIGDRPTPFGASNITDLELAKVARKLGLTYCRHFTNWETLEPRRGQWDFEALDATVAANREAGLIPWICLVKPASWVMPEGMHGAGFEPFPFDPQAWKESITTLATRYKGKIWGFEWLNEIVPGNKSPNPVADYLRFCEIGTTAVRQIDPAMKVQLAGGLWPRNFRTDVINAGVCKFIDVLPVHYNGRGGVLEAASDIANGGIPHVETWDNETAAGISVWNMPAQEALMRSVLQSRWVMRQWPSELTAGARGIVYFGGMPQSAGNWTYLLDRTTPRPVAATLAVLSSKIGLAKPVGTSAIAPGATMHLFERDGQGVAVISSASEKEPTTVKLALGSASVLCTDHQGNETTLAADADGYVTLGLTPMPVFLEGFRMETLAAYTGLSIGGQDSAAAQPSVTVVAGADGAIPVHVANPLSIPVTGTFTLTVGKEIAFPPREFALDAGTSQRFTVPLAEARKADGSPVGELESADGAVALAWVTPAKASISKPFGLVVVRPESLGNLLQNGDMEAGDDTGVANWKGSAAKRVALGGDAPGFVGHALRFEGGDGWKHAIQTVALPASNQSYLYSAWVWSERMDAGSNLVLEDRDGTSKSAYMPHVFSAGNGTRFWRLLTHRRDAPASLVRIGFQPVAKGAGFALFDNVRVTLYDGTDYATEAYRAATPVAIDGALGEWRLSNPIPLLCDNQLTVLQPGYAWTPTNLAGVAFWAWDDRALYLAAQVRDDRHVAVTGAEVAGGDSLTVALHPANRAQGAESQAFLWHLSEAAPGGGSGRHTLYRSTEHSGGLPSGHLARDSSVYELSVARRGDLTIYELRIPWSETGGVTPGVGTKFGLSLQLNDNDGDGRAAAMTWGGGLQPSWNPAAFGVATLVE